MVAPTCDLISSPIIGTPASSNLFCQYPFGLEAMNTGMQFINPHSALSTCSTYHFVASSDPTGR